MSTPPEMAAEDLRRSRILSVADGVMHAVMLGACESYLGALAVELGHTDDNLALLATLPLLCGAMAQLGAAPMTRLAGGRKRFVVAGASLQAVTVFGLAALAAMQTRELAPLLVLKTLFWTSGAAIVPAWGAWMAHLTGDIDRERYFARRSGLVQLGLMVAFVGAGALLHRAADERSVAFASVFAAAGAARCMSVWALVRKTDTNPLVQRARLAHTLSRAVREGKWRIPAYLAALMFGAHVSVPFFTPYMLRSDVGLGLDYSTYTGLLALAILTKAIAFPLCSKVAARFGLRTLLIFGGAGLATIPLVWTLTTELGILLLSQLVSGVVWAALEFASFQLLLQGSPDDCRSEYLSLAGFMAAAGQLCGALLGGELLARNLVSYTDVFFMSAIFRGSALLVLLIGVWRLAMPKTRWLSALAAVRPTVGGVRRPLPFNLRVARTPRASGASTEGNAAQSSTATTSPAESMR